MATGPGNRGGDDAYPSSARKRTADAAATSAKALAKYLSENPGYVGKNWEKLQKNPESKAALTRLGYYVSRPKGGKWTLRRTGDARNLWSWGKLPSGGAPYQAIPVDPKTGKRDTDKHLHDVPPKTTGSGSTRPGGSTSGGRTTSGSTSTGGTPAGVNFGGTSEAKQLAAILAQAQKMIGSKVAPTITDAFIKQVLASQRPDTRSETEAGLAYDSTIGSLRRQMESSEASVDDVMSDMDKYYGMVGTQNEQAKAANAAALTANADELGDSAKAFMAAAGGAAQEGNASVAAQAVINEGALRSMGQAQSNFDSNLGQFFSQAGASHRGSVRAEMERNRAGLAAQLNDAERERSLFKSKLSSDYNTDHLNLAMQLRDMLYNQRTGAADTQWNRLLGTANLVGMASTIPQAVQQGNIKTGQDIADWQSQLLLNEQQRAQLQHFRDTYMGPQSDDFSQLQQGDRAKLAASLMANTLGPKGYLTINPKQFLSTMRNRMYNIAGYDQTPQTDRFINSLLEPRLINWWNKYHPKQRYTG